MYCRGFSFALVTRVWDVFFSEGYKIVYRVALALVKVRTYVHGHVCALNAVYLIYLLQSMWINFEIHENWISAIRIIFTINIDFSNKSSLLTPSFNSTICCKYRIKLTVYRKRAFRKFFWRNFRDISINTEASRCRKIDGTRMDYSTKKWRNN